MVTKRTRLAGFTPFERRVQPVIFLHILPFPYGEDNYMRMKIAGVCLLMAFPFFLAAQKQLALIGGDRSVRNFPERSYINLILKDGRKVEGQILQLMEFSMITTRDTIPFNKIRKIGIPKGERKTLVSKLGVAMIGIGIFYVSVDQINRALGYTTNSDGEERVIRTSAFLVATGGILIWIKPKYQRVNAGIFLRTVDYKSPFYKQLN